MNCCRSIWNMYKYESPEIAGWLKVVTARGPETVVGALYTATALTFLAEQLDTDCDEKVDIGFIKLDLSSILAAGSFVENIVNLICSPFWGSLADTTPHRKILAILSCFVWVGSVFFGALVLGYAYVEEVTLGLLWIFFLSFLLTTVFYELALLLLFAYLPEIVKNEEELTSVTSRSYAIVNGLQLGGAILLIAVGIAITDVFDNDLPLTMLAHMFVVVVFIYLAIPGFRRLPNRPMKAQSTGKGSIAELWKTLGEVKTHYPQIGLFLLSFMFYFAGVSALVVLQVVYVQDEFDFGTTEVGILGGVVLIFSVVGALLAEKLAKKYRMKSILTAAVFMFIVLTLAAPVLMRGQDREEPEVEEDDFGANCTDQTILTREPTSLGLLSAFLFSILGGMGIGMVYPMSTSIYALIIPGGKEASFFGLKTFGAKAMSWAPPLLFAFVNESIDNVRTSFLTLALWFVISLPFLWFMDVEKGIKDVEHTMGARHGAGRKSIIGLDQPRAGVLNPVAVLEAKEAADGPDAKMEHEIELKQAAAKPDLETESEIDTADVIVGADGGTAPKAPPPGVDPGPQPL